MQGQTFKLIQAWMNMLNTHKYHVAICANQNLYAIAITNNSQNIIKMQS